MLFNDDFTHFKYKKCENIEELIEDVLSALPPDYEFIDYVYEIRGNSLSTFHRDVTSSSHIYKTKYPIYTLILYKCSGKLFSFCPNSNTSYPFVWSNIINTLLALPFGESIRYTTPLRNIAPVLYLLLELTTQYSINVKTENNSVYLDKFNPGAPNSLYFINLVRSIAYK